MNVYQKLGFGVFATFVVACLLQDRLTDLVIVTGIIALMTLKTTWLAVFTGTQAIGAGVKAAGQAVARAGSVVQVGSSNIKAHLKPATVPSWDEVNRNSASDSSPADVDTSDFTSDTASEPASELDVPEFIRDQWGLTPNPPAS